MLSHDFKAEHYNLTLSKPINIDKHRLKHIKTMCKNTIFCMVQLFRVQVHSVPMISHHSNVQVPADTLRLSFNHFTVYAKSTLAAARCDGMKRMISLVNVSLVRSNQWIGKDAACFIHYPLGSKMIQVHVKLLKKTKTCRPCPSAGHQWCNRSVVLSWGFAKFQK